MVILFSQQHKCVTVGSNAFQPELRMTLNTYAASKLKGLGIYQIVGGAVGVLLMGWAMLNAGPLTAVVILLYLIILVFFVFSIYCGAICVTRKSNALDALGAMMPR